MKISCDFRMIWLILSESRYNGKGRTSMSFHCTQMQYFVILPKIIHLMTDSKFHNERCKQFSQML